MHFIDIPNDIKIAVPITNSQTISYPKLLFSSCCDTGRKSTIGLTGLIQVRFIYFRFKQVHLRITTRYVRSTSILLVTGIFICMRSQTVGNPVPSIITVCHVAGRPHRSVLVTASHTHGSLATTDWASMPE
jgi:hypothetical protein